LDASGKRYFAGVHFLDISNQRFLETVPDWFPELARRLFVVQDDPRSRPIQPKSFASPCGHGSYLGSGGGGAALAIQYAVGLDGVTIDDPHTCLNDAWW
jgi:hypothetical protein